MSSFPLLLLFALSFCNELTSFQPDAVANDDTVFSVQLLNINTEFDDYGPTLFHNQLIFNTRDADPHFYYAKIKGYKIQGEVAKFSIQEEIQHCEYISYADNGLMAAFVRDVESDSEKPVKGIYMALTDKEGKWQLSEPFPHNSSSFSNTTPFLANAGKTMYFSSNKDNTSGHFDIYISHRVKGQWKEPQKLSDQLNTSGDELSPFFNNGSLYFSSNGHPGMGGFDLFRAEFAGPNAVRIYSLGAQINTPYDEKEILINPNDQKGYFVSNRPGGKGKNDLYYFEKISGEVQISITDTDQKAIADASVFVPKLNIKKSADIKGICRLELPDGEPMRVVINKPGYNEKIIEITADLGAANRKNYNVQLNNGPLPEQRIIITEEPTIMIMPRNVEVVERNEGYNIQLAALKNTKWYDEQHYSQLNDLGRIYHVESQDGIKILLGSFNSATKAREILEKVKLRGYSNAFIKGPVKSHEVVNTIQENGEPKIRLAILSNLEHFDETRYADLGQIKIEKKGINFILFLERLNKNLTTNEILDEVRKLGFPDAYMVK